MRLLAFEQPPAVADHDGEEDDITKRDRRTEVVAPMKQKMAVDPQARSDMSDEELRRRATIHARDIVGSTSHNTTTGTTLTLRSFSFNLNVELHGKLLSKHVDNELSLNQGGKHPDISVADDSTGPALTQSGGATGTHQRSPASVQSNRTTEHYQRSKGLPSHRQSSFLLDV